MNSSSSNQSDSLSHSPKEIATHYRMDAAAAWACARFPDLSRFAPHEQIAEGIRRGLDLHMFKRTRLMPRVSATLGLLLGLGPADLLDLGTGRGSFLWPLLEALPELPVTCVDLDPQSIERIQAVGSVRPAVLQGHCVDLTSLPFGDASFDCVTLLETLEHIPDASAALQEALRVAQRWLVVSVPSEPDENPEHIHLFTEEQLRHLTLTAGGRIAKIANVSGHWIALISPAA